MPSVYFPYLPWWITRKEHERQGRKEFISINIDSAVRLSDAERQIQITNIKCLQLHLRSQLRIECRSLPRQWLAYLPVLKIANATGREPIFRSTEFAMKQSTQCGENSTHGIFWSSSARSARTPSPKRIILQEVKLPSASHSVSCYKIYAFLTFQTRFPACYNLNFSSWKAECPRGGGTSYSWVVPLNIELL